MRESPWNGCPVLLTERIPRVNEEKPPLLILQMLFPKQTHGVYGSIPASTPPANCSVPQADFASCPVTHMRHFASRWRQVSPISTVLIPGHLSSAINRLDIIAQ